MAFEDVYADEVTTVVHTVRVDEVNENYQPVLQQLLPPGPIWRFEDGGNAYELLRALSYSLSRISVRGQKLLKEFNPATMLELLSDWERVLGLPGDNPSPPSTIADRRLAVQAALSRIGSSDEPTFEDLILALGYSYLLIAAKCFKPFAAGSSAGEWLWNNTNGGWAYFWAALVDTGSLDTYLQWLLETTTLNHTGVLAVGCTFIFDSPIIEWLTGTTLELWFLSAATGAITEVGSGEGRGGVGSNAANFFLETAGSVFLAPKSGTEDWLNFSPGDLYVVEVDVSYFKEGSIFHAVLASYDGLLYAGTTGWYESYQFDRVGRHRFVMRVRDKESAFLLHITLGSVTVDAVKMYGPLPEVLGSAPDVLAENFASWSGGDPVGWSSSLGGTNTIDNVRVDQAYGGAGSGAVNLKVTSASDNSFIIEDTGHSVTVGKVYELHIHVGYASGAGPLGVLVVDSPGGTYSLNEQITATGSYRFRFTALTSSIKVMIGKVLILTSEYTFGHVSIYG